MTPEERAKLDEIDDKIDKIHNWLFDAPITGGHQRAKSLDEVLSAVRAGRFASRTMLYLAGFIAAVMSLKGEVLQWFR